MNNGALVLGLSEINLQRLREGRPIHVRHATHGPACPPDMEVILFYGKTEADMEKEMRSAKLISQETTISKDPRLSNGQKKQD